MHIRVQKKYADRQTK